LARDSFVNTEPRSWRSTVRSTAIAAVDGSFSTALAMLDFAQQWSSNPALTDEMVDDWRVVLDTVLALEEFDGDLPVGYWGLSMGTILGLPLVAAEARITACVLGLMGATGPTKDRIVADAARVSVPTLFSCSGTTNSFTASRPSNCSRCWGRVTSV
jgi:hypothetical protein